MKQRINLSLDEKLIGRAKLQAVLQRKTVSEIVEELLQKYLDDLEKRTRKTKL